MNLSISTPLVLLYRLLTQSRVVGSLILLISHEEIHSLIVQILGLVSIMLQIDVKLSLSGRWTKLI